MAFIIIPGPQGRPLTFNPVQINYIHVKPDVMSVDLYGEGAKGAMSTNPAVIADFLAKILPLTYFLDLRTSNEGTVVNMSAIREVDYIDKAKIINIYFNNVKSHITIPWIYKTALEDALANFNFSVGGGGTGARWMRRRGI